MNFWDGFEKRGAMLSKYDSQGGTAPRAPEEMAAAQGVDLITLPKTVEGANCANCRYMKIMDTKNEVGMCQNPNVMQEVTGRMHCSQWDAPGAVRNYEPQQEIVTPGDMQANEMQQQQMAQELGQETDMAAAQGAEQQVPQMGAEQAAANQPPAKKPAKKKEKSDVAKGPSDAKHEINIHVGGAGKKGKE